MKTRQLGMWVTVAAVLVTAWAGAAQLITEAGKIEFYGPTMNSYGAGFSGTSGGYLAVADGLAHLVQTYDANHQDRLEYRRWDPAAGMSGDWAGSVVRLGDIVTPSGSVGFINPFITVDGGDRVSIIYQERSDLTRTWYQRWCANASGSDPLNAANWSAPAALGVPAGGPGSVATVSSDTILLAQYRDGDSDGDSDITIEKGVWNGSGYTWTSLGVVLAGVPVGYDYGCLRAPNITVAGGVLHMSLYSAERGGQRGIQYAQSSDPLNPVAGTWSARELLINPNPPAQVETNGGVGVTADGTPVALVWGAGNRDGGAPYANFQRVRGSGGWGAWQPAFVGDMRYMPTAYGAGSDWVAADFASDGTPQDGLFALYDRDYISYWDPETQTWADVFTNFGTSSGARSASLGVDFNGVNLLSRVYAFNRGNNTLYVGYYMLIPEPGTLALLGGLAAVGLRRRR